VDTNIWLHPIGQQIMHLVVASTRAGEPFNRAFGSGTRARPSSTRGDGRTWKGDDDSKITRIRTQDVNTPARSFHAKQSPLRSSSPRRCEKIELASLGGFATRRVECVKQIGIGAFLECGDSSPLLLPARSLNLVVMVFSSRSGNLRHAGSAWFHIRA